MKQAPPPSRPVRQSRLTARPPSSTALEVRSWKWLSLVGNHRLSDRRGHTGGLITPAPAPRSGLQARRRTGRPLHDPDLNGGRSAWWGVCEGPALLIQSWEAPVLGVRIGGKRRGRTKQQQVYLKEGV
uniref:Uncharacterized protein n=1 Tax=Knipowitschia caucasica TaxID=637954 RepID=A0AAV2LHL0_KNICA